MIFPKFDQKDQGFSLVELMIVVGIIGILAALAIPRFQRFQAKARMAEAKNMLSHIFTLQEAYHLETNKYTKFGPTKRYSSSPTDCVGTDSGTKDLGLDFTPCNATTPRYTYEGTSADSASFTAEAKSGANQANQVCPGQKEHTFSINQDRNLSFKSPTNGTVPRCD